jgi:hypothetical protein
VNPPRQNKGGGGGGQGQNGQSSRRRRSGRKGKPAKPVDLWRPVPPLPEPAPIVPAGDPTALVRSLGEPPLPGAGADMAIAAVVARAAGLAEALARVGGLAAEDDDDLDGGDAP